MAADFDLDVDLLALFAFLTVFPLPVTAFLRFAGFDLEESHSPSLATDFRDLACLEAFEELEDFSGVSRFGRLMTKRGSRDAENRSAIPGTRSRYMTVLCNENS